MFLIEYQEETFIDGEKVDYIHIAKGKIIFTLAGDSETIYASVGEYAAVFLNNIQALNSNIVSVESRFDKLNKE